MSNREFNQFNKAYGTGTGPDLFKANDYISAYKNPFDIYIPKPQ